MGTVTMVNADRSLHNQNDQKIVHQFLSHYVFSSDTLNSYRRDVERFVLWANIIQKKSISECVTLDISDYLKFFTNPPKSWSSETRCRRIIAGTANENWRPFMMDHQHKVSHNTVKSMLAILSTFFEFCHDSDYIAKNPVKSLKQKKQYNRQYQEHVVRKISETEWHVIISLSNENKSQSFERMRQFYTLSLFYLLGVRISEIAATDRHQPTMGDFYQDEKLNWWFRCIGKGNKQRDIAVPDHMLEILSEFRGSIGLKPLPSALDSTPMIPKMRGTGGCGIRQIRNILDQAFKESITLLKVQGEHKHAEHLQQATAHWLRHTAISHDVESRPLEHVRDDAGHGNIKTTSHYITTDRTKRHQSAKDKQLGVQ